ncbi:MAG: hypothetical protein KHX30_10625 [Clostridium sp.]|nr:hypothetical protein [Clostridium sp.]
MKFYNILMAANKDTEIKIKVRMFGMTFSTTHFPEFYIDNEKCDELVDREVTDIKVNDNVLELTLAEE